MMTLAMILLIASLVTLILAAIQIPSTPKVNLQALGLALFVAWHVVQRVAS